MIEFNSNSPQHLSMLLFGGTIQSEEQEPVMNEDGSFYLYKSGEKKGQIKYQKILKEIQFEGLGLKPLEEWKTKKEGIYQTNETVLEYISQCSSNSKLSDNLVVCGRQHLDRASQIAALILEIRGLKKQISTYYDSTLKYINENGFVHASFSHCATDTGRLGCSRPNIQNQPDRASSRVKQHFITRYGTEGELIQADYSQIEPCTHAQLSEDPGLLQDLHAKVDTYCKYLSVNTKLTYEEIIKKVKIDEDKEWIKKRKQAKTVVLADRYGAGTKKLMQQSDLSYKQVKNIQDATQILYPKYTAFNRDMYEIACKEGVYKSFTERFYKFDLGTYIDNKVKNYIYQGTAFDIYSCMLGKFWREKALHNRDKYVMINTIHDSVILDCQKKFKTSAEKDLKTLERVKLMCYNYFNYNWIVPIKIDINCGKTWYDL